MKLKYYLRGMGIGIILTAIVMGFALGGRKKTISDAEVIERAKALGMVEGTAGTLSQYADDQGKQEDESNEATSDTSLDEAGAEISEEIHQEVASADQSVSGLFEKTPEGENPKGEVAGSVKEDKQGNEETKEELTETEPEETTPETPAESAVAQETKASETPETSEQDNSQVQEPQETEITENDTPVSTGGFTTSEARTINIPGGLSSDSVAAILYKEGIVDNATNFNRYLIEHNKDRYIRSGTKTIPAGADYEQIANIICRG